MMAAATMMIKEKPSLKLRHEIKYTIDPLNDWIVSHRLRKLFKHDNPPTNENQFDVEKSLNENWDKIDEFAGEQKNVKIENMQKEIELAIYQKEE